ncbi:MAG: hypothetical protein ACK5JH_12305 [Anaerocolumna sp.]
MGVNMKKSILVMVFCCVAIFLFGCNTQNTINIEETKSNTIFIKNDGTIQAATVETFDKDYYSSEELEAFITENMNDYNEANNKTANNEKQSESNPAISLESLKVDKGYAVLVLNYASIEDYNAFNEKSMVFTTLSDVNGKEITLPDVYVSASDGAYVAPEVVLKNEKYKVIIVNDQTDLIIDGKIKYFTNGKLINKSRFEAGGEKESVIIYKP